MTDFLAIDAIVNGIINAENSTKQELGRRFAAYSTFHFYGVQ